MMMLFPVMEAVRSGGNLENIGELINTARILYVLMAVSCLNLQPKKLGNENFYKGKFFD